MPRRNLVVLLAMSLVAVLCQQRVQKNAYGRILADAMARIEARFFEPIEASRLFEGAMEGMMGKLDENSAYIPAADMNEFRETVDQEFVGVGLEIGIDPQTKQLTVLCPVFGSPASKAGIRPGDRILRIRGLATQGMTLADAAGLLRGRPGESVPLTILHEGEETPVEITIVRDLIQADTVRGDARNPDGSWSFRLSGHDRIGYLRISSFTDKTVPDFKRAVRELLDGGMRGMILDLRDNPGGYLDAAVNLCNLLIPSGVIVTTRGRDARIVRTFAADGSAPFLDFPLVVLVNQESASAAEITAACLQDHRRAVVVGQRTFGKGTIQDILELDNGCGAMKITTSSYWRPSGKNIAKPTQPGESDLWGVLPDPGCEVVVPDEELQRWRQWRFLRDAVPNTTNGNPTRSQAAKELLNSFTDRPLARAVEWIEEKLGE